MAYLPDTDNEEKDPRENPPKENIPEDTDNTVNIDNIDSERFRTGFLAGCVLTLLCVLVFLAGWLLARSRLNSQDQTDTNPGAAVLTQSSTLSKLDEIQSLIEQNFLEEVDGDVLSSSLFQGVAAGLQDDYAAYYSAQELQSLKEATQGEYFGIGATLMLDEESGEIQVLSVYADSPAEEGGLQEGDILLAVDGESLEGFDLSDTVALIRGKEDAFILEIYRPETEETLELSLTCGNVEMTYVEASMQTGQIGYIRLTEFTESAVEQFRDGAQELLDQGMEQLIVDLRGNPGGLLDSVCDILDEILPERLLVYTENKSGEREEYYSDEEQLLDCPVAVLVDENSASASEIFAGAVQDWELGPVIGAQTYGKGVVQKTYSLSDGSAVKFTVSKYYTPKGQDIDGNGITPDIVVEETKEEPEEDAGTQEAEQDGETEDPVLEKALEVLGG